MRSSKILKLKLFYDDEFDDVLFRYFRNNLNSSLIGKVKVNVVPI